MEKIAQIESWEIMPNFTPLAHKFGLTYLLIRIIIS